MPTYWEVQLQTVTALAMLGIKHEAINRIDLFKMRCRILREYVSHSSLSDSLFLLDELARMRKDGNEAPHDGKRYI